MGFKDGLDNFNRKISYFFSFVAGKLKNFKNLTLGEQISYSAIGVGLIMILASIVLFVI